MKILSLLQLHDDKSRDCIYVIKSAGGKCIYIGRTSRSLKSRIREHLTEQSKLGSYLGTNKDVTIEVYKPAECMEAIEYIYGPGWNPNCIGLVAAEESMIAFWKPLLNKLYYKAWQPNRPKANYLSQKICKNKGLGI